MLTQFLFSSNWQLYVLPAAGLVAALLVLTLRKECARKQLPATPTDPLSVSGWVRQMRLNPSGEPGLVHRVEEAWR